MSYGIDFKIHLIRKSSFLKILTQTSEQSNLFIEKQY